MSKQDRQSIIAPAAIVATGLAAATAAIITSSFGVAGTLIGTILTPMIISAGSAIYKAYIESASSKIRYIPGSARIYTGQQGDERVPEEADSPSGRSAPRNNFLGRFRAALSWFTSLPPFRRRSILVGALVTGVASLLLSVGAVTGVELAAGKSLSCWVWNECPTGPSARDGNVSGTSTQPSLLGGGQSAGSSGTPQVEPADPRQQPNPGAPGLPSEAPNPETLDPPAPGQQQSSPSGGSENQQPTPSK